VLGNEAAISILKNAISGEPRPHTYLIDGPFGCGKTTLARILSSELGAKEMDICEFNAANTRGIDTVRDEIVPTAALAPMGDARVFIIDESQQLTGPAQQSLLKVTEDCPPRTYFIFCTTEPAKINGGLRSRACRVHVEKLKRPLITAMLKGIRDALEAPTDDPTLEAIADASEGSPREALVMFEVVMLMTPDEARRVISSGTVEESSFYDCMSSLVKGVIWTELRSIYKQISVNDPERLRRSILGYLKGCLLREKDEAKLKRFSALIEVFSEDTYAGGEAELVNMLYVASQL
jgi:DNA polymerase-3 subunit gamma/tau